MQNKKKKLITSSDKSQRYMTLTTMHREQINMLGNINQNIKNNVDNLKEIASDINRLVNFIISKKKSNEYESIEFLDENFDVTK